MARINRGGPVGAGSVGAGSDEAGPDDDGVRASVAGGAAATSAGLAGGAALASATIVLLPFVALGGAWGMAKMKRAKKENAIKAAMSGCLKERGHEVAGWEKTGRKVTRAVNKAGSAPSK